MPFGEYRGAELCEIPSAYLKWLPDLDGLRDPLKTAVEVESARRAGTHSKEFYQHPDFRIGGDDRKIARQIVESGRRALAKVEHPDAGGSTAIMSRVNVVADSLLESLR